MGIRIKGPWYNRKSQKDVDMNSYKLTNVSDPTDNQDVATKSYVDSRTKSYDYYRVTQYNAQTVSSTDWGDVSGLSQSFSLSDTAVVLVIYNGVIEVSQCDVSKAAVRINCNGTIITNSYQYIPNDAGCGDSWPPSEQMGEGICLNRVLQLSPGDYTIKVQAKKTFASNDSFDLDDSGMSIIILYQP